MKSSRITIEPLTRAHLKQMAAWRPFDDPLYSESNWMSGSYNKLNRWYTQYKRDPRRRMYAVVNASRGVIGCLTLREIDGLRSARLGITLGADFVGQGYGTQALALFLDYYFEELGFAKMVLDVAAYNLRAIQVYKKLGFETVSKLKRPAGSRRELAFLKHPRYAGARQFFSRDWLGRRRLLCYEMELSREKWSKNDQRDVVNARRAAPARQN
jgi:RimJ/RimL family protein N-acetyltransferase